MIFFRSVSKDHGKLIVFWIQLSQVEIIVRLMLHQRNNWSPFFSSEPPFLNKSERQAKFSLLFISMVWMIFNNSSSRRYFWKKQFLTTIEEFNFLQEIFLEKAPFDSNRRIQPSPDDNFKKNKTFSVCRKRTLSKYTEDISGSLPKYELINYSFWLA